MQTPDAFLDSPHFCAVQFHFRIKSISVNKDHPLDTHCEPSALYCWILEILYCDPKGRRTLLRVPSTEGRSVCLCWAKLKPKGPKGLFCESFLSKDLQKGEEVAHSGLFQNLKDLNTFTLSRIQKLLRTHGFETCYALKDSKPFTHSLIQTLVRTHV